jgi:hypothetical protein
LREPGAGRGPAPGETIEPEPSWPRWLEADGRRTDQTSGLSFVGRDSAGAQVFLLADDVGDLWRLTVSGPDDAFGLRPVPFVGRASESLARFPKRDLEEITVCPHSGKVLVSIEGNGPKDNPADTTFRNYLGIYDLEVSPSALDAEEVTGVTRLDLPEWREASRMAAKNVGFEAAVLCGDTLILGLEGVSPSEGVFADSTFIEVYDLGSGQRRETSTRAEGLVTITGLARSPEGRYYGIDRNGYRLFAFDLERGRPARFGSWPLSMPGVHGVAYLLPSAEAVAVDDAGFVWVVVDPWKYQPVSEEGLTPDDLANYRDKVPLIYKYRVPHEARTERSARGAEKAESRGR